MSKIKQIIFSDEQDDDYYFKSFDELIDLLDNSGKEVDKKIKQRIVFEKGKIEKGLTNSMYFANNGEPVYDISVGTEYRFSVHFEIEESD